MSDSPLNLKTDVASAAGTGPTSAAAESHSAPQARRAREVGIEATRLIAAMAIVWAHSGADAFFAGIGGLLVFTAITARFAGGAKLAPLAALQRSAQRLLIPWAFWSIVYGVARGGEALLLGTPLEAEFSLRMLVVGTSLHLWYLPFAFVVTTVLVSLPLRGLLKPTWSLWLLWAVAFVATTGLATVLLPIFTKPPVHQWLHAMAGIPLGLALATVPPRPASIWPRLVTTCALLATTGVVVIGLAARGWGAEAQVYGGMQSFGWAMIAGGGLVLLVGVRRAAGPFALWATALAYGIYLVHPLLMRALMKLPLEWSPHVLTLVVFILSAAVIALMRRTPLRIFT